MNIKSAELNTEELEDIAFSYIMEQEDKTKTVPMDKLLKKLREK